LARITGVSPATLHRELRALSELGLLTRREVGRQVFYSANRASAMFPERLVTDLIAACKAVASKAAALPSIPKR